MPAIPDVVTGTTIATTWGDAVKDALNLPVIRVERITSGQTIATGTSTTIIFNNIVREDDEAGSFSHATGTGILTVAHAGWYHVEAGCLWDANATGYRALYILVSGTIHAGNRWNSVDAVTLPLQNVGATLYLTAGATITVEAQQTSGANRTISAGINTHLTCFRIRSI